MILSRLICRIFGHRWDGLVCTRTACRGREDATRARTGTTRSYVAPAKCVLSEPHMGPHLWVDVVARSLETGEFMPVSVTVRPHPRLGSG